MGLFSKKHSELAYYKINVITFSMSSKPVENATIKFLSQTRLELQTHVTLRAGTVTFAVCCWWEMMTTCRAVAASTNFGLKMKDTSRGWQEDRILESPPVKSAERTWSFSPWEKLRCRATWKVSWRERHVPGLRVLLTFNVLVIHNRLVHVNSTCEP